MDKSSIDNRQPQRPASQSGSVAQGSPKNTVRRVTIPGPQSRQGTRPASGAPYRSLPSDRTRQVSVPRNATGSPSSAQRRPVQQRPAQSRLGSGQTPARRPTQDQVNQIRRARTTQIPSSRPTQPRNGNYRKPSDHTQAKNTMSSVLKAVIYIAVVIVISAFLSIFAIEVCNDMLAFVGDESEVTVTLPENATLDDVTKALSDSGVVKYGWFFKIYAGRRSKSYEFQSGEHTLSRKTSYDNIISEMIVKAPERVQVSVMIPEGYTIDQIIEKFVDEEHMGTREGFEKALEEYEWDYWFVTELKERERSSYRRYLLEGYLYPDTYFYFSDANETTIVWKMLENFNEKFSEPMRDKCTALNMRVDEVVTLASIIRAESKFPYEYMDISSVFHNRMKNIRYETAGYLGSDTTVIYSINVSGLDGTGDITKVDTPYNTYMYRGLPPGPICNPSLYEMNCAMYPNSTPYYYFYAKKNQQHVFAKTYEEHLANIRAELGS